MVSMHQYNYYMKNVWKPQKLDDGTQGGSHWKSGGGQAAHNFKLFKVVVSRMPVGSSFTRQNLWNGLPVCAVNIRLLDFFQLSVRRKITRTRAIAQLPRAGLIKEEKKSTIYPQYTQIDSHFQLFFHFSPLDLRAAESMHREWDSNPSSLYIHLNISITTLNESPFPMRL